MRLRKQELGDRNLVGNRVEIWAEDAWNKADEDDDENNFSVLAKFGV